MLKVRCFDLRLLMKQSRSRQQDVGEIDIALHLTAVCTVCIMGA